MALVLVLLTTMGWAQEVNGSVAGLGDHAGLKTLHSQNF